MQSFVDSELIPRASFENFSLHCTSFDLDRSVIMPSTHRRRRRFSTAVELSRVGVGNVH